MFIKRAYIKFPTILEENKVLSKVMEKISSEYDELKKVKILIILKVIGT